VAKAAGWHMMSVRDTLIILIPAFLYTLRSIDDVIDDALELRRIIV
jgi:hypothetical protein